MPEFVLEGEADRCPMCNSYILVGGLCSNKECELSGVPEDEGEYAEVFPEKPLIISKVTVKYAPDTTAAAALFGCVEQLIDVLDAHKVAPEVLRAIATIYELERDRNG